MPQHIISGRSFREQHARTQPIRRGPLEMVATQAGLVAGGQEVVADGTLQLDKHGIARILRILQV